MKKFLILFLLLVAPVTQAADWPASDGTDIGGNLTAGYEPSGIVWQERLEELFLVWDNGYISQMGTDGTVDQTTYYGGDFEGLTLADSDTNYIYVGVESPDSIKEFDVSSWEFTGKTWDLTTWMTGADNQGLEALTYVDGYFYAGLQADGKIYVFDVDLNNSGTVSWVQTIDPPTGISSDISGLYYSVETEYLYAVYDSSNLLVEMETDGTEIARYDLPGQDQEGITFKTDCASSLSDVFIAQDSGEVNYYQNYPSTCLVEEEEPDEEDPEEEVDEEVTVSDVEGLKNGKIKLTYSDNSTEKMVVFDITETVKNTKVKQFQDDYYLVLHPRGKKVALVNVNTKEVLKKETIATTKKYPQNSLKVMELQDRNFAVAISQKKSKVRVYIVKVLINQEKFGKDARLILTDSKVKPSRASKYKENKIKLRGTKGKLRHTLKVNYKNKKYNIIKT